VEAHALSSHKIVVSWKAIPQNTFNGILQGYIVQYTDIDKSRHNQVSVNGLQTSLIDLTPFTRYRVRVIAYTNAGLGVASVEQIVRTYEDSKCVWIEALNMTNISLTFQLECYWKKDYFSLKLIQIINLRLK